MFKNKVCVMFALMLIWVFIISISTAGVGGNLKMDDPAVKYDLHPKIESGLLENEEGTGKQDVFGVQIQSLSIKKVVFELNDTDQSYIKSLEESGASIEIVYENLVQASIPASQLEVMSDLPFVNYVRSPRRPYIQTISEGVGVINATPLNNLGIRGQGVKIAVIDVGFAGYQSKLGTELPVSGNVTVRSFSKDGDITGRGETHGTAVAEIIYDIAPDAQLYLIQIGSDVEFYQAVNYAISQKVDIISMSMGWIDGPFDGTSKISAKVDSAVSSGIIWVNCAGNYGQKHWEGKFNDPDNNKINNFTSVNENMSFDLPSGGNIGITLSWDAWQRSDQNYDLYLYNSTGSQVASSRNPQNGTQEPVESISKNLGSGTYNLQIWKYNASRDVTFELYSVYQDLGIQFQVSSRSLIVPADAHGAITVGSTYWFDDSLEPFSSRGPTTDGRPKPDLVAPDRVQTSTSSSFYGTSASAPHVAGAAALLKSINLSLTPLALRSALKSSSKSLGDINSYGSGIIDTWKAAKVVDNKPPMITFTSPADGKKTNVSISNISGIASDNAGVTKVEVRIGTGTWQTASGTMSWKATVNLLEGKNIISAKATDIAGNVQETSVNVTLDTKIPVISIVFPSEGLKLNASNIIVSGTGSDNDLSKVEVRVRTGTWQTASGTTSWNKSLNLSQGLNKIFARAMDTTGNVQETSVNVTLDVTPPSIEIMFPTEGKKFNVSTIVVRGTASDNNLSKMEVRVGTGTWQTASGKTSWNATITLSEGKNIIYARAIDIGGNVQEKSVNVTLDTGLPTISIVYPINGQKSNISRIIVNGTASDNDILSNVEVRIGNESWQEANGTTSWDISMTLSEGQNNISARTIDTAGNVQEISVNVILDTVLPTIDIISPVKDQYFNMTLITTSGTASDNDLSKVEVKIGNDWQTASGTTPWSATIALSEGKTLIYARASDTAGNINETSVNVTLDTTKPEVSDLEVFPSTLELHKNVSIKARMSDNVSLNSTVASIKSPDGNTSLCRMTGSGNYTCTFVNTSDYGRYDVTILASDLAGNTNDTEKTWFITTMKPYENNLINTIANKITLIDALKEMNTTLEFVTSRDIKGTIKLVLSNETPPEINPLVDLIPLKFINITASPGIENNLTWMNIKLYYMQDELKASLDENSLRISYYNASSSVWETPARNGVNTTNNGNFSGFAWVNVSRLGTFALVGNSPAKTPIISSGGGGSGGGGGGGGGSGEDYTNIELIEKYDLQISKDVITSYRFTHEKNPVMFVDITGNTSQGMITTSAEVLKNTSTLVKIAPGRPVYKNVNMWVGTSGFATPRNIKQALIKFRVENSWMSSNNIQSSGIKMVRWNGTAWNQLETTEKNNDGKYAYYESWTNVFSPFAIIGRETKEPTFENTGTVKNSAINSTETIAAAKSNGTTSDFVTEWFLLIGVFFAIGSIIVTYLWMKKK